MVTNRYPIGFDAASFGNFLVTSHQVAVVYNQGSQALGAVWVGDASGGWFQFRGQATEDSYQDTFNRQGAVFVDWIGVAGDEVLSASPAAPSAPDDIVPYAERPSDFADNAFVDVDVFI